MICNKYVIYVTCPTQPTRETRTGSEKGRKPDETQTCISAGGSDHDDEPDRPFGGLWRRGSAAGSYGDGRGSG